MSPNQTRLCIDRARYLLGSVILVATIATGARSQVPTIPATENMDASPATVSVPFQELGGLIVIPVDVEGQHGSIVLDTGCPGLLLRSDRFGEHPVTVSIGGIVQHNLHPIAMSAENQGFSIQDLEQQTGHPLLGLLGLATVKPFEVILDYRTHMLTLVRLDTTGHRLAPRVGPKAKDSLRVTTTSENGFRYYRIKLNVTLGEVPLEFVLDTGSPDNGTAPEILAQSATHCVRAAKREKMQRWNCPVLTIAHHTFGPLQFVADPTTSSGPEQAPYLLGSPFLHALRKVGINLRAHTLYIY